MKSLLIVFTVLLAIVAITSAAVVAPVESFKLEPVLQRMRRENCDYNSCDRLCRQLKFPGGACVKNKCKCDNF